MSILHGNEQDFDNLVSSGIVLVDFYADWCGPCRMLGPVLEDLASDRDEVSIVKINVDHNEQLAKKYGIMSIPTLLLFKDGKHVSTKNGFAPKEVLIDWINEN